MATTDLILVPEHNSIKQGELVQAKIQISGYSGSLALNGANISDTLYFYKTAPFIRNAQTETLETEATIIFLKVPKNNFVTGTVQNQPIRVSWKDLTINPVEAPESFIFGNFEIPKKINLFWFITGLITAFLIAYFIRKKMKQLKTKKLKAAEIANLKSQLVSASDYTHVLEIWQKKHLYLEMFPKLQDEFLNWEQTLFKYVFKPHLTEIEKQLVISSYNEFKQKIGEKISGI